MYKRQLLLCSLPRIIGAFSDDSSTDDAEAVPGSYSGKCYYTEDGVHIEGAEEALRAALPGMEILPIDAEKAESIRETVKEDPDISVISVTEKDGMPLICLLYTSGPDRCRCCARMHRLLYLESESAGAY